MSMNLVTLLYLLASVCFIQALKGLSHPTTSIRGNVFGMSGMAIAVLTTGALIVETAGGSAQGMVYVMAALVLGGAAGTLMAQRVEMTKMPELVAFMHSMIGLAAVFIAVAAMAEPMHLERFWSLPWDALVVRCTRAVNPPEAHQRRTAGRLGAVWAELDTGHYPMLSTPDELVALLLA